MSSMPICESGGPGRARTSNQTVMSRQVGSRFVSHKPTAVTQNVTHDETRALVSRRHEALRH